MAIEINNILEAICMDSGKVNCDQILLWLMSDYKDERLSELNADKSTFVSSFLEALRKINGNSVHTSSPRKSVDNDIYTKKLKNDSPKVKELVKSKIPFKASRAKTLDFSDLSVKITDKDDSQKSFPKSLPSFQNEKLSKTPNSHFSFFYEFPKNSVKYSSATPIKTKKSVLKSSENLEKAEHLSPDTLKLQKIFYQTSTPLNRVSGIQFVSQNLKQAENASPSNIHYSKDVFKSRSSSQINNSEKNHAVTFSRRMSDKKSVLGDFIFLENSDKPAKRKSAKGYIKKERKNNFEGNVFNINNVDDFPVIDSSAKTNKRRINPTKMTDENSNCESLKSHSNAFITAVEQVETNSLDLERKLLKEKKEIFRNNYVKSSNVADNSLKFSYENYNNFNIIRPYFTNVTSVRELNILAELYSSLILQNLVPNVVVELHFILQLLTIVEFHDQNSETMECFSSIHCCVYFSVKTLSFLYGLLILFDKGLLNSLKANERIQNFDPILTEKLNKFIEPSSLNEGFLITQPKSPIFSVSFQAETDNRNNFPFGTSFHMFRKQRDLFYEILRKWEQNHLTSGWDFKKNLETQISQLFNLQSEVINLTHLAQLFLNQLLAMCKGNSENILTTDDNDISLLCQLKKKNPEKFKRLYNRLVTPLKFGSPVPLPSFSGAQEFFKNFILVSSNFNFMIHLKNIFANKILELNNHSAFIFDLDEKDNCLSELKSELSSCIQSLRIIAKFLGFIEFLPYQSVQSLPDLAISSQISIRNTISPPLPFITFLKDSISSGSLTLLVPWLISFLSMLDAVALQTKTYLTVIYALVFMHKKLCYFNWTRGTDCKNCANRWKLSSYNILFLRILIGWFLSLPNIPEDFLYIEEEDLDLNTQDFNEIKKLLSEKYSILCLSCLKSSLEIGCKANFTAEFGNFGSPLKSKMIFTTPGKEKGCDFTEISPLKTPSKSCVSIIDTPERSSFVTPKVKNGRNNVLAKNICLDVVDLIDYSIILQCCPFLQELKGVLHDFSLGNLDRSSVNQVRKITPFTTSAPHFKNDSTDRSVQGLLEDNFFHNQPPSVKKSVEFLSERISSNVIREVRTEFIPQFKEVTRNELKQLVSEIFNDLPLKCRDKLDSSVKKLSGDLSSKIRCRILDHLDDIFIVKNANNLENGIVKVNDLENGIDNLSCSDNLSSNILENSFNSKFCSGIPLSNEVKTSLRLLIPSEVTDKAVEICCEVVEKIVRERVQSWINSHLAANFCIKELSDEAGRIFKQILKRGNSVDHSFSTISNGSFNNSSLSTPGRKDGSMKLFSFNGSNSSFSKEDRTMNSSTNSGCNSTPSKVDGAKSFSTNAVGNLPSENLLGVKIHDKSVISPYLIAIKLKNDIKTMNLSQMGVSKTFRSSDFSTDNKEALNNTENESKINLKNASMCENFENSHDLELSGKSQSTPDEKILPDIAGTLSSIRQCLIFRQDVTLNLYKALEILTVDWMSYICVFHPEILNTDCIDKFLSLWQSSSGKISNIEGTNKPLFMKTSLFSVFLSHRMFHLIENTTIKQEVWNKLKLILLSIVSKNLLPCSDVQTSFISLLRVEWSEDFLKCISKFISDFLSDLKKVKSCYDDDFVAFLDWVGWFMNEMNSVDHLDEFF